MIAFCDQLFLCSQDRVTSRWRFSRKTFEEGDCDEKIPTANF